MNQLDFFGKCEPKQTEDTPDSTFGKMSQVHILQTKAGTFVQSLNPSQRPMFQCLDLDTSKVPGVFQAFSNSCFGGCPSSETGQTLTAKGGGIRGGSNSLVNAGAVRRLTPLECERLMGLPDGYTDIPGASDSARYKAIGNGMAIPCSDYVLSVVRRMADVLNRPV